MEHISIETARKLMLSVSGLTRPSASPETRSDALETIRRMGYLQIDTIHVVARSPYLVLWSRLGDYPTVWLDELLAEGKIFEFWSHAMCFLPVEDYPYTRRRMLDAVWSGAWPMQWAAGWVREHPEMVARMRGHLQERGEVRSAEFEGKGRPASGWWDWKDEKNTLEAMLLTGEVMVLRRQNFQRIYTLRERVRPDWDDADLPSSAQLQRWLDLRSVEALGIATASWASDVFRQPKNGAGRRLDVLAEAGELLRVEVEKLKEPAYLLPKQAALIEEIESGAHQPELTTLLSPFDPLVADRRRARELFGFDYQIECYLPKEKRRYGYFTLPILHRGSLVGRLDPKAHRSQGIFEVKSLHFEPGTVLTTELAAGLAEAIRKLAGWHGTPQVVLGASDPPEAAQVLKELL